MTGDARIERALPRILADLGTGPLPDYTDSILTRTAAMSQRPGWTFIERWIPMDAVSEGKAAAPRVPWRAVAVVALIILTVAIGAVLIVGSRHRELPPSYGPAANGLVVYAHGGDDIYVGDPATGQGRPITSGPEVDHSPFFSRDGSKLMFQRSADSGSSGAQHLMIANVDGSGVTRVTDEPLVEIGGGDWSGDGRSLMILSSIGGQPTMTMFDLEKGTSRVLDVGMAVESVQFRPPDGRELLFVGIAPDGPHIYVMGADGSNRRSIVASSDGFQGPTWSPDGSRIAYSQAVRATGKAFTHIVGVEGSGDVVLDQPTGAIYQLLPVWSPDGTSLLVGRGYWDRPEIAPPGTTPEPDRYRLAVISADGSVPDREFQPSGFSFGSGWDWSPDGTKVVTHPTDNTGYTVVDIATGDEQHFVGWFEGQWQRVAAPR
jgi:Tol biopolymer transport system component